MNLANSEMKVGIFSLVALISLFYLYMWLNGIQVFERGSQVEAAFDRVEGLRPGAAVKFSGVDIGRITKIYFDDNMVIVVMRINPGFEVPRASKAMIGTSGVIGDKFLEIVPLKPDQPIPPGNRILGENLISMEQFYTTAYDVLNSLKEIASDIKTITSQFQQDDNGSKISALLENMLQTSNQLAQASNTANKFLREIDSNGETAANLRSTLADAQKVAANLEKFSAIIAAKGPDLDLLIGDAHQTMQSINQAAQTIDKAITKLTSGDGEITATITQASQAAQKVSEYVSMFEKISVRNSLGAGYQYQDDLAVDYQMDVALSDEYSLLIGIEDIGQENMANFQWVFKQPSYNSRIGVYNSQFGLGFDFALAPGFTLGVDLWDTNSANIGLTSAWRLTNDWSFLVNGSANTDSWNKDWTLELWRHY